MTSTERGLTTLPILRTDDLNCYMNRISGRLGGSIVFLWLSEHPSRG